MLGIALLVVAADQWSKSWIRTYPEGWLIYQVGFLRLIHIQNTGAAFGLFRGHNATLSIIAIIGIVLVLSMASVFSSRLPFLSSLSARIGMGLMLGGACGNLVDRLSRGYVTDFIDVGFWPAFNVADSAITTGVIVFALTLLISLSKMPPSE